MRRSLWVGGLYCVLVSLSVSCSSAASVERIPEYVDDVAGWDVDDSMRWQSPSLRALRSLGAPGVRPLLAEARRRAAPVASTPAEDLLDLSDDPVSSLLQMLIDGTGGPATWAAPEHTIDFSKGQLWVEHVPDVQRRIMELIESLRVGELRVIHDALHEMESADARPELQSAAGDSSLSSFERAFASWLMTWNDDDWMRDVFESRRIRESGFER